MIEQALTDDAKAHRRNMLMHNMAYVIEAMDDSDVEGPVGFIFDMNDKHGGALGTAIMKAQGKTDDEIQRILTAYSKGNTFPTMWVVLSFEFAKDILMELCGTFQVDATGRWLVAVGAGGNSYLKTR